MKYMQNGGFQNHPLMRLTLLFTLFFLAGLWVTHFLLYFSKMGLTPASVTAYYLGSEEEFRAARTYLSMVEVTHFHLPMMGLVLLMLTHLLIFSPFSERTKIVFITLSFASGLSNEISGWLVRFVHPGFSWLKILSFATFQAMLAFLLGALALFLWNSRTRMRKLR